MAAVKIVHDREGKTVTGWFGDPAQESSARRRGDEVILMKDRSVRVIGFEKLNFSVLESDSLTGRFGTPRPLERNLKLCARKGPSPTETAQASVQIS